MTRSRWPNIVGVVAACLIFSGLSVYLACKSESDLEADATTHFLIARYAPHEPAYFIGVWGRPLCTAVYALTAHFGTVDQGRLYTRFLSLGLALLCALITLAIGKKQGFRWPGLVVIFLLAQPLFFLHSFSELTEIPFAVLLMLGFLAYQRRQFFLMAFCVSLLPMGRPEGFGFILMAAVALIAHRRKKWLPVLALPFFAWNYVGWYLDTAHPAVVRWYYWLGDRHCWNWVFNHWPYSYESTYGKGPLLSFVVRLPVLTSPLFFPFMLVGFALAIRWMWAAPSPGTPGERGDGGSASIANLKSEIANPSSPHPNPPPAYRERGFLSHLDHRQRCEILIALIPLSILIVHSLLWWRGKMGSNGELRYLLIVGPFFALLGARGWEWAWQRFQWRAPMSIAGLVALTPILANFKYHVVPFPLYDDGIVSREAADWYRDQPRIVSDFPLIMPTLPQVFYYMDVSQSDAHRAVPVCKATVKNPPHGAVMLWDPIYGPHNSSEDMCVDEDLIDKNGWIYFKRFSVGSQYVDMYLSPRTASGQDARKKYGGNVREDDPFAE